MKKLSEIWECMFRHSKKNDGTIEFYYPRDNFMVLGGAGSGKQCCVIDGKEGILIDLTLLNAKEYYKDKDSIMLDDNVCPVNYRSYRIWAIRSTIFFYAVECDRKFYVFDVRKVGEQMQVPIEYNSDFVAKVSLHRHEWMAEFVKKMNETEYVIDVEGSIELLKYH